MGSRAGGRPVSVQALEQVVDGVAGRVSRSRTEQLRMVVAMWERALAAWPAGRGPRPDRSAAQMFQEEALRAFWELARGGGLRARPQDAGRVLPVATLRVVRDCLGILAEQVVPGGGVWLPVVPAVGLRPAVPVRQLRVLYRGLVDLAGAGPLDRDGTGLTVEDRTRLLAMVAVVLDTGARSGELATHTLDDLAAGEESLRSVRRPPNGWTLPVVETVWPLQEGSRVAVRRWLAVREQLVAGMEGTAPRALWVSLRPNSVQPRAGFPLQPRGVRGAYGRGVAALNWVMAGQYGWEPLPGQLERLARTVRAELGEGPRKAPPVPVVRREGVVVGRPRLELTDGQRERARELLADPGVPLARVAAAVGVSEPTLRSRFPQEVARRAAARRAARGG